MWQQLLLPLVAFAVPVGVGALVSAFGFNLVLAAIPVVFAAAAVWFSTTLRLPASRLREKPAMTRSWLAPLRNGAAAVFRDPVLRIAAAGFMVFNMLNPLVLAIFAPMWSLLTGSPEKATSVFGWVAGLYSVGWLLAGAVMALEQRRMKRQPADSARIMRRSLLTWMCLCGAGLSALATFAFTPGDFAGFHNRFSLLSGLTLPAITMIPFGLAQVLASVKLRNFFQSRLPEGAMADGMAFLYAAALALATLGMLGLKFLFGAMSGLAPFTAVAWCLPVLALLYFGLTWALARRTRTA